MTHSKIFQVSEKRTTDTNRIHYVNADTKKQALEVAKEIWNYVTNAEDVTDNHFSEEEKANLPKYVIIAKEWVSSLENLPKQIGGTRKGAGRKKGELKKPLGLRVPIRLHAELTQLVKDAIKELRK